MPDSKVIGLKLDGNQPSRGPAMTLNRAYLLLLLSLGCLIGGSLIGSAFGPTGSSRLQDVIIGSSLIGFVGLILAAFAVWAGAKGYSPWLGFALAWIGPLGMLVLVFLEDKSMYNSGMVTRRDTAV